ncbi:MAG: GDSL-type esterase/lipase family protein [Verrucomicrobiota bacterium]
MKVNFFLLTLATALTIHTALAGDIPATQTNKTDIVCLGDSITRRGYPEIMGRHLGLRVVNGGVAGNTSAEGLKRIQKDVVGHDPDIVVIFFGTNDGRVDAPKKYATAAQYAANLNLMVDACEKIHARVVLCTLPPVNETAYFTKHPKAPYDEAGGLAKLWSEYRAAAVKVAANRHLPLVDLNHELLNEPQWLGPDGVHPTPAGNEIIARLVAKAVEPLTKKL